MPASRPLTLKGYVGQERIKTQLYVTMGACHRSNKALPHILLHGNAGLGKTTLAQIIASEFGVGFHEIMASNVNNSTDIERVLEKVSPDRPDIIFIDEIHRLPMKIEELLYPLMEDGTYECLNEYNEMERFEVYPCTIIGATTMAGDISRPLRDRFGLKLQLVNYNANELASIVRRLAKKEKMEVSEEAQQAIAQRSKGVARNAVNFFDRCKEYALFMNNSQIIDAEVVSQQFQIMGIDEIGLDDNDYRVLTFLAMQPRPVGADALATGCDIDRSTLERLVEPYLVQVGMVSRTRSGREITEKGLNWLQQNGVDVHPSVQIGRSRQSSQRNGMRQFSQRS